MANKIKLKRGVEANLPTLDVGEPAFTTDTKKPFIGSDTGNVELATKEQINSLDAELDAIVANATVDSEVILARDGNASLDARLDVDKAVLTTQINERTTYGVVIGLRVTAQATPDMTVSVATGTIYMANGTRYIPAANNALAVTAADATNPRIDIVYINSSGVISCLAGTAGATPSVPSVPAGGMLLATISVPANDTTIESTQIADRSKFLWTEAWITPTLLNGYTIISGYPVGYMKDTLGFVHMKGLLTGGTANQTIFTLPIGYRPLERKTLPVDFSGT